MRACLLIRAEPHYRREAFEEGLRSLGYNVKTAMFDDPGPEDVLITWNRYEPYHSRATRFERAGARVIVAENGYCGKDDQGRQLYALALSGHNGSGQWYVGEEDRFGPLGLAVKPRRQWAAGGYHLVCGQRGIGSPDMASPKNWHLDIAERMRGLGLEVKVREHPGKHPPARPLADDLAGATMCLIWSSGCGVQALLEGIPVYYAAPHWICEAAAGHRDSPDDWTDARAKAFHRMAWAQWRVSEIAEGIPFRHLLGLPR